MPRVTWMNLADAAIAYIDSRITFVGKQASWSNPELATWESLRNSVEMELLRRKSRWSNLGVTEEEHLKEMLDELRNSSK
jgi:hypothetical protein